jgi:hypothetical protein
MANMRPDMLYQYLLDEVGRKQPKIVKVKRGEIVDDDDAIELEEVERIKMTGKDGATGTKLVLVGGASGESVSKNTALLLARSRSERAAGRSQRQRRVPGGESGNEQGPAMGVEENGDVEEEESGDILPELPHVAATRMSSHETLRRNTKRLTM